jgi:hypothetical protein
MGDESLTCDECGAALRFEGVRTTKCPYCACPSVLARPARKDLPNPDFVVAFVLGKDAAHEKARAWTRSRGPFTHGGVKHASFEDMRGVYVPAYLYGALARSSYSAKIGENYTETETYTTTENGKTVTKTRTVVKTEWRSLAGSWAGYVRDVVVSASRGLPNALVGAIEPFDLRALRRYDVGQVQGWLAEEPSMDREACIALARTEAQSDVGSALSKLMPGDSHSGLSYTTTFEREIATLVLVPVWVFAVRYAADRPPVRLVVNGQTGRAWGKAPLSWQRIAVAVVLGLAVVLVIALVARGDR